MTWLRIETPHAVGAVALNGYGFVVEAAPIFGWTRSRHESALVQWVARKGPGYRVEKLGEAA